MRRDLSRLFFSLTVCLVSLVGCGTSQGLPTSVETGLDESRTLASLDATEIERACDGWLAYADVAVASDDGPFAVTCTVSAAFGTTTREECEAAYVDCIASSPARATFCATQTRTVPTCDPSVTIERYESCMTTNIDAMASLDVDCSLAADHDELRVRLAAWTLPAECEVLAQPDCAPFAVEP